MEDVDQRPLDVLFEWQRAAVEAWSAGDGTAEHRGTLEVFTGGGKTVIGLACFQLALVDNPEARLVVVVPTVALARQWRAEAQRWLGLDRSDVGQLGGGAKDSVEDVTVLIAVLNSATKVLPKHGLDANDVMLIVDECHRAGAPTRRAVLKTPARYRLGLSATPQRDETDEDGLLVEYDTSVLGRELGRIVYRFGLREARRVGWLPTYELHHHAVTLHDDEREEYEKVSRRVDDAADTLRNSGHPTSAAQQLSSRNDDVGEAARLYVSATSARKDLLYRARERTRVASLIIRSELASRENRRILAFHERVDEAVQLHGALDDLLHGTAIGLEHSKRHAREREAALAEFADGSAPVLVSVKSLVEGIDVPAADVGVSVAASSSVRQRVQALGRVLRRSFDETEKHAAMHLLYVDGTVDDAIYGREDWGDIVGHDVSHYWRWPTEGPVLQLSGPPRTPLPTEEQVWEQLGGRLPSEPTVWPGVIPAAEFSLDTRGNVTTMSGLRVGDTQGVGPMLASARGSAAGRFRVTPEHKLVLTFDGSGSAWLVGQLEHHFRAAADAPDRPDAERGTYKIRSKRGGVIERRRGRDSEFALSGPETGKASRSAQQVLDAWRLLGGGALEISVARDGLVWALIGGAVVELTRIDTDFAFASDMEERDG